MWMRKTYLLASFIYTLSANPTLYHTDDSVSEVEGHLAVVTYKPHL